MTPGRARHRPVARRRRGRPARHVVVRGRGLERSDVDLAPRRHGRRSRPARAADDLANDLEDGARLFDQLARTLPEAERPRAVGRGADALRDTTLDVAAPGRTRPSTTTCSGSCTTTRCGTWSPPRRATRSGSTGRARCTAPGTSSSRARSAPSWPATRPRRPARPGTAPSRTRPSTSTTSPSLGFDVVYLPPIHPIGEVNRKGPNNTLGRGVVGRRLAVGDRLARRRARRDPSRARHDGRLHRVREAGPRAGPGGRARLRAAVRARPSVGDARTRSGSPPSPTARSPTPRTRRRSTRTSTR